MNYELAKQLRDAGFPQHTDRILSAEEIEKWTNRQLAEFCQSEGMGYHITFDSSLYPEPDYKTTPVEEWDGKGRRSIYFAREYLESEQGRFLTFYTPKHIASCESWGDPNKEPRQFLPDGSVVRGYPNPNDIGLAQINAPIWQAKAESLGFDIYTASGNLEMAKWIFDHYGSQPWFWSEGCWGKYQ